MLGKKPFSLGKTERLKSRKQIDALFESGKKITQFPFRLLYHMETGKGELKAGFTVGSKNFPRAADRNRIKRLVREAYRRQNKDLKNGIPANKMQLHLFFIYTGREIIPYEEISARVKQILDKLVRIIHEENATDI